MSWFMCGPNSHDWGLVWASLPASSVEQIPGTVRTTGEMAHSWFDWTLALIAHVPAISAQGAVAGMLTVPVQGKLIEAF